MAKFRVSFRWYESDTFCTNICIAENEDVVKEHYCEKYKNVTVSPASDYAVEDAKRRGMPVVTITHTPATLPDGTEIKNKSVTTKF